MPQPQTIAVLGAGTMGNGIAHVCARSGFNVLLCDLEQSFLDRGLATIDKNLAREVSKEKLTQQQAARGPRPHHPHHRPRDLCSPALSPSKPPPKSSRSNPALFRDLDRILPAEAILASNTSSISITKLAAQTSRPAQVIGMHFFNPVPVMTLVEVIRGLQTSQPTFDTVKTLAASPRQDSRRGQRRRRLRLQPRADAAHQRGHLRRHGRRRHRRGRRSGLRPRHGAPHGTAHAGRLHRPRRLPRHHARARTKASATPSTAPARCSSAWSMPAGSAANPAAAFTPTPTQSSPVIERPSRFS